MKLRPILALGLLLGCLPPLGAAEDLSISNAPSRGELEVSFKGKRMLLYSYGGHQFKPYIKELYSFQGLNVLQDAPADHLHHHGLMYAIRVNGVNFWEEVGDPGHELSGEITSKARGKNSRGLPCASFTQQLYWVRHSDAKAAAPAKAALLKETRTITLVVDAEHQEPAVEWRGAFEVGAVPVTLTGSFYNGLGLRPPASFDHVARHENSANLPYSAEALRDVTPAHWSAMTGNLEGRERTLVLFESPANKGKTQFYTMLNPFAYLSVTQNLDKEPIQYAAGDRFAVRYLFTVYDDPKRAEFLNQRHREWLGNSASKD